eukprot:927296-Pleurochrysis_carterae.AAC.1
MSLCFTSAATPAASFYFTASSAQSGLPFLQNGLPFLHSGLPIFQSGLHFFAVACLLFTLAFLPIKVDCLANERRLPSLLTFAMALPTNAVRDSCIISALLGPIGAEVGTLPKRYRTKRCA